MTVQTVPPNAAPVATPPRANCRVSERHPCGLKTSCQPVAARADNDFMWPAIVRDVSVSGIGLVLPRRFERGAGLAIEIPRADGNRPESLLARVVHATSLPRGLWLLGCSFPSPLSEDELQGLLRLAQSQKQPAPASEPAAEPPAAGAHRAFLVPDVTFETVTAQGVTMRLRVKALRLTGAWPLAAGTTLKLRPGSADAGTAATELIVNSCREVDGHWTVRYAFAAAPSAEVLRSFGHP
jgi:hypothetical protein